MRSVRREWKMTAKNSSPPALRVAENARTPREDRAGTVFSLDLLPPPWLSCALRRLKFPSPTMPRAKESTTGASTAQAQQDAISDGIDSFELPRSLIMKLARASQVSIDFDASNASIYIVCFGQRSDICQVPENTKFSKDVILSILKASTVFVNYLGTSPLLVQTFHTSIQLHFGILPAAT